MHYKKNQNSIAGVTRQGLKRAQGNPQGRDPKKEREGKTKNRRLRNLPLGTWREGSVEQDVKKKMSIVAREGSKERGRENGVGREGERERKREKFAIHSINDISIILIYKLKNIFEYQIGHEQF